MSRRIKEICHIARSAELLGKSCPCCLALLVLPDKEVTIPCLSDVRYYARMDIIHSLRLLTNVQIGGFCEHERRVKKVVASVL